MKNLILLLVATFATAAYAQTNLVISFTNTAGNFVSNAQVVKVFPNKLMYRSPSGGGTIRLGDLPLSLQKELGFNRTNAIANDTKDEVDEQSRQQDLYDQQQVAAQRFQVEKLRHRVFQTCRIVWGRVVQKLPGGLLIDSGEEAVDGDGKSEPEFESHGNMTMTHKTEAAEPKIPGTTCLGLIFLTDYPDAASLGVNDYVQVIAYRIGEYIYHPAASAQTIIRKFTADFDKANAALP